jgi:hypothetical protein
MKKQLTLFLLLTLLTLHANAQTKTFPIDSTTKKITYTNVVNLDGTTKDVLYKRAKNLGIAGAGTQKDDPTQGVYIYKGSFNVSYRAPQPGLQHTGKVDYQVTLACKDGRYKYIITNFIHSGDKGSGGKLEGSQPECGKLLLVLPAWSDIRNQTMAQMDKFIASLIAGMEGQDPNAPKIGSDW